MLQAEEAVLDTARLRLRPCEVRDITPEYLEALNDPSATRFLVGVRQSRQDRQSVERYIVDNRTDPHAVLFGVFLKEAGRLIGTVRVHGAEQVHGTATMGVCIFPGAWGHGYGTEAIRVVSDWAFGAFGARYLEAACYEANDRSVAAFRRAGFAIASRFDEKYLLDGIAQPVVFLKKTASRDGGSAGGGRP